VEEQIFERPSDFGPSNHLPPYPFFIEPYQDIFGVIDPLIDFIIGKVDVGPNQINGIDAFVVCEKILWEIVEPIGVPIVVNGIDGQAVVDMFIKELIDAVFLPVEMA
jgi:hypothetical protein